MGWLGVAAVFVAGAAVSLVGEFLFLRWLFKGEWTP